MEELLNLTKETYYGTSYFIPRRLHHGEFVPIFNLSDCKRIVVNDDGESDDEYFKDEPIVECASFNEIRSELPTLPKYIIIDGNLTKMPRGFFSPKKLQIDREKGIVKEDWDTFHYLSTVEGLVINLPYLEHIDHYCVRHLSNLKYLILYAPSLQRVGKDFGSHLKKIKVCNIYTPNLVESHGGFCGVTNPRYFCDLHFNPKSVEIAKCKDCEKYWYKCICLDF